MFELIIRSARPLFTALLLGWSLLLTGGAHATALSVSPEGVLLKDGKPYRGIGVNVADAFFRIWEHGDVSYDRDFATLEAEGIPFARISATYYPPDGVLQFVIHRQNYLAKLDGVVASAEKHHIGLIMDLFFWDAAVPDLVHEPISSWGDPNSRTIAFMREYTHAIVARYKDSPAVWAWEFGNEYSLLADLPNAAQPRPDITPGFGWPAKRTKADDLTTKMILVAFTEFAKAVREVDPTGAITTGNGVPRQSAEEQRKTLTWNNRDTPAQFRANITLVTPDPMDMMSIHIGHDDLRYNRFREPGLATYDEVFKEAMKASVAARKPLFIGELSTAMAPSFKPDFVRQDFEKRLKAVVDNKVPLAAFWQVTSSIGYGDDPLVLSRAKGLGYMFDEIKAANAQIAEQVASEQRVADLLPQFEAALKTANHDTVRALQKLLADRGFKPGAANGRYGPPASRALAACIAAAKCTAADLPAAK